MPQRGPEAYSEEWYALRSLDRSRPRPVVFGASDAATLIGWNPYRTPLDLYCDKLFGSNVEETQAMRMGKLLEPIILGEYQRKHGGFVFAEQPMYFSSESDWLGATPDALWSTDGDRAVVDAKASNPRMRRLEDPTLDQFGEPGTDEVPRVYFAQAQALAYVLEYDRVDFEVLFGATAATETYTVWRSDRVIKAIVKAAAEMGQRLLNGEPPDPDWSHPNTKNALLRLNPRAEGDLVMLPHEMEAAWEERERLAEQIKELEARKDELRNRCLAAMGSAEYGRFPSGGHQLRRIYVGPTSYTVEREAYEYLRKVKVK